MPSPCRPLAGLSAALPLLLAALGCASTPGGGGSSAAVQVRSSSFPAGDARVLGLLTSGRGNLVVRGAETDSLTVQYVVSTRTLADALENQVETIDKRDTLVVTIRPTTTSQIDLQLEMPEKMTVDLRDEQGRDVTFRNVENRVDVVLHPRGSLDFDDIEGPLQIQDGLGPIRIHDVRGPVVIQDEGGGIAITDVKNSLRIDARSGDVTIQQVGGDVHLVLGAGDLTVREVGGKVSYRKTGPGKVTIEEVTGPVERL